MLVPTQILVKRPGSNVLYQKLVPVSEGMILFPKTCTKTHPS